MDVRDAHSLANKPIIKERDPLFVAVWIHRIVLKQLLPARVYTKPGQVASSFFKNKGSPSLPSAFRLPRKQGPCGSGYEYDCIQ
ncbi:MAG: hypothetical protein COB53_08505 [Elusimicrobia bacterium]|nr:MAG: hypothetical protein COB53_08505 [Elusimicrobiota bacterium]